MTSWPPSRKFDVIESPTPSIDAIYLKNTPVKFHPDPIWNDEALSFFWRESPQQQQQQQETEQHQDE